MAEADLLKARTLAKSNLTRSVNILTKLLQSDAPRNLVDPEFTKMNGCWEVLEAAQDKYVSATTKDLEE